MSSGLVERARLALRRCGDRDRAAATVTGRLGLAVTLSWGVVSIAAVAISGAWSELRFGVVEELLFRGVAQGELAARTRGWLAPPVVAAVLFALAHVAAGRGAAGLLTFFPGLVFGGLRLVSGSVWPAVAAHAVANAWLDAASMT